MAGEIASAFVSILPSFRGGGAALTQQLTASAGTAGDSAGKTAGGKFSGAFGGAIKGIGPTLAGAFAVSAVGSFFSGAISGASDLNETVSKVGVIFGDQSGEIKSWSEDSAKNLGLPQQAALDLVAGFGDMFTQLGFGGEVSADMAKGVAGLSADLGSFNNLPTEDVAQRIAAAFRGEYDSLQTLIPNINAARVEQQALGDTGKKSAKDLTAAEKAAAVLAIVNADGAKAAGDFARTSDGLANKQKILAAQFQDVKTTVGSALVPAMTALVGIGVGVIDFFTNNAAVLGEVARVVGIVAAVITTLFIPTLISMGVSATINAAKVAAAWVVTQVGAAKAALIQGGAVVKMVAGWVLMGVQALLGAAKVALAWLIALGPIALVVAAVIGLVALIIANFDTIKGWIAAAWEFVKERTTAAWNAITGFVTGAVDTVTSSISTAWETVKSVTSTAWEAVKTAISEKITAFMLLIEGIPGKITSALTGLGSLLYDTGADIIQGLIDGIVSMFNRLRDMLQSVTNLIPDWKGPASRDAVLLRDNGRLIMQGLEDGLRKQLPSVRKFLQGEATSAVTSFQPNLNAATGVARSQRFGADGGASAGTGHTINLFRYGDDLTPDHQIRDDVSDLLQLAGGI